MQEKEGKEIKEQYLKIVLQSPFQCPCKKCLIDKLLLECENEILNATETLHNDKK